MLIQVPLLAYTIEKTLSKTQCNRLETLPDKPQGLRTYRGEGLLINLSDFPLQIRSVQRSHMKY